MERPNLPEGIRNALVMVLANPGFTLVLLIFSSVIVAISILTAVPLLLITGSMIACIATAAALDRLERYRITIAEP